MYSVNVEGKDFQIEFDSTDTSKGKINNNNFELDAVSSQEGIYHLIKDNKSYNIEILNYNKKKKELEILINGNHYNVNVKNDTDLLLAEMGLDNMEDIVEKELNAPMPGLVIEILVKEGDVIKKGDSLLVLEAMKMENTLKSTHDAVVKTIKCIPKQVVEKGAVLLEFE